MTKTNDPTLPLHSGDWGIACFAIKSRRDKIKMADDNDHAQKTAPPKPSWGKGDKGLRTPRDLGDDNEGTHNV